MSSLNKSLSEFLGLQQTPTAKKTISNQLFYGHVLDVIYGEDSIWYAGADSVGAVRMRLLPINYNKPEDEQFIIAYPLDRTHYRVPLPGETILAFVSFGPAVQGTYQSRYYYWKILTTDQNLTYSGLPFTGTDAFHLKPGPKILVSDADKKTFAKRFDDKLGIDKDLLADKSSLQQPRLGERTIESRFGSMIKFSSSPSDQSTWNEETQVNNSLATSEGDPLLIINVDRKVVGSALTLKDISVDKTKGDDTNMFLTTTQNVPISLGCSTRMLSWDVDLRAGLIDSHAGVVANLAAELGGGFDASGGFKIALKGDITFTELSEANPGQQGLQQTFNIPKVEGAWEIANGKTTIADASQLWYHHSEKGSNFEVDAANVRVGGWSRTAGGAYVYDMVLSRVENGTKTNRPYVPSPIAGKVTFADYYSNGEDSAMHIQGIDGKEYKLLHMDNFAVSKGSTVTRGQLLGRQSDQMTESTGFGRNVHLHIQFPDKQVLYNYIRDLANNGFGT